jgi:rod shape-determining protein MreC
VQILLALIRAFRDYLVLFLLSGISILLIATGDSAAVRTLRTVSIVGFASFQSASHWFTGLVAPREDGATLREINVGLLEEVMQMRHLQRENAELRRKIGFRESTPWPLIPAEIVGKSLNLGQRMATLNVGSRDSAAVNMPVISEDGLVGRVVAVSPGYCVVQLSLNRDFRATTKVRRSRVDGIVTWRDGDDLQLRNIFKTADVKQGDTVMTSGYSSMFPPDIMVGTVTSVGPGETGMFRRVVVRPSVDFARLERVFIVRYVPDPERARLEENRYPKPEEGR